MTPDRKARQRKAVEIDGRFHRLSQDGEAQPPVSATALRCLRLLLVDDDKDGEGLTSRDIEEETKLPQPSISKALKDLPHLVRAHLPDTGLVIEKLPPKEHHTPHVYKVTWKTACPVCGGTGICDPEEVQP